MILRDFLVEMMERSCCLNRNPEFFQLLWTNPWTQNGLELKGFSLAGNFFREVKVLPNMGSQGGDWFRNDGKSQENWKTTGAEVLKATLVASCKHLFLCLAPLQHVGLCAHWHTQVVGILWKLSGKLLHVCSLKLPPRRDFRNVHLPVGHALHLVFISCF